MTHQTCICCGIEKPLDMYEKQKDRPNHRKKCKQCRHSERNRETEKKRHRDYMRNRRKTKPDAVRKNWERSVYGVCKEDLNSTCCEICGSTKRLCIDHDHSSQKVRGILCSKCNAALGMFDDDTFRMLEAIKYLTRNQQ